MRALTQSTDVVPLRPGVLSENVLFLPDQLWDLLPVGVYVCDRNGAIVRFNRRAAELWGREPKVGDPAERFCGSFRFDGGSLPRHGCPVGDVLRTGISVRDQEV